jgi:hypothetical protein
MMHRLFKCVAAAFLTASAAPALLAAPVLDQQNLPTSEALNSTTMGFVWQQEVRAGVTGRLSAVDLYFGGQYASGLSQATRFFVNRGAGWQTDANDHTEVFLQPVAGSYRFDLSSALIELNAGETFVLGIEGIAPVNVCCDLRASAGDYADGRLLYGFGGNNLGELVGFDMSFSTFVDTQRVPLPSSILLSGIGLLAAARMLRGGKAKKAYAA